MTARTGNWITRRVRRWLENAEGELAIERCGGDQRCPWCRQWMNQFFETIITPLDGEPDLDEVTCGNCGGSSAWKWEMGFIFVTTCRQPTGAAMIPGFGDGEFIRAVVDRIHARLASEGQSA